MAQTYTRQSTFSDGDTITAALFNDEYNQLVNAFTYSSTSLSTTGHRHDGTAGQGGNIPKIGDLDFLNKIEVDSTNNRFGFYVEVSSAAVEQVRIQDGAIVPVTDNDIDLGTSSLEFKDLFLDGTATIDTLTVDEAATVGTTLGVTGATTLSSTLAVTGATTLSSTLAVTGATTLSSTLAVTGTSTLTGNVTTTNDLSVGGNLTVTGTSTFNGGTITMGDAASDNVVFGADVNSNIIPNTDNTYDLGSSSQEWKDIYIDGTAYLDAINFNGTAITATAAELNIMDGVTATATEINLLDGVTSTTAELNILDGVTATTAELNIMDGVTSSTAELNILDGVTATATELNLLDGVTSTTAELNILDGVTATATELNLLDGVTSTTAELNILDGVTSTAVELNILDGKAFLDEDDMSSNSATGIASQQSIKAYVDSQLTAQDLDFQGDSGGALSIDLDSETLTIAGGTGLDTTGSSNTLTIAIDSTVATLTGTQTLTNKTLTAPVIATISNTGTLTLPTSTDTLVGRATTDTLTNKTLTSAVLNTSVSGTAVLDEDDMASNSATKLITQQSAKAYIDATATALAIALG